MATNLKPHHKGIFGQGREVDSPLHVAQQRLQIESSLAGSRASQRCPHVPRALTRRRQFLSRFGELIFLAVGTVGPDDRPDEDQGLEPFGKNGAGHAGNARRMSLKRRLPHRISRTTKSVHRPPSTSWARAIEQNCPYPVMRIF